MKTIQIKTLGMHCPSCSMLIEMNLADLVGVESVKASNADSLTTVTFDESALSVDAIVEEIRNSGYEAELIA